MQSSLNGSASNLQDSAGRSFATSFSAQSGAASPVFHHPGAALFIFPFFPLSLSFILLIFSGVKLLVLGSMQGMHNIHGSFNIPNMQGTLTSRNSSINNVPSGGVQQPSGTLSSGRFASNNLPVALSQVLVCFYCVIQHVLYSVNKGYRNVISVRYLLTSRMCSVNQTCGQTNMFCIKCIKEVPGTAFEEHLCAFENFSQLMCLTK